MASSATGRIIFLTHQGKPDIADSVCVKDTLAASLLLEEGFDVRAMVWDSPDFSVQANDFLILRSTWDYHLKQHRFLQFLADAEDRKLRLCNPVQTVRWNFHKRYLLELEEKGIPIAKTRIVEKGSQDISIADFMREHSLDKMVVKSCIGCSGYRLKRIQSVTEAEQYQGDFKQAVNEADMIMQENIQGIETNGEFSMFFFDRKFSHCAQKIPVRGDFKAYSYLGAAVVRFAPSSDMMALAEKVIGLIPGPLLYTRVDLLRDVDGRLVLGELEMNEPSMYLDIDDEAPRNFVNAIKKYVAM